MKKIKCFMVFLMVLLMSASASASEKDVDPVYLSESKHVWWETDFVGKWSSVKRAHEYQVKLFISDFVDRDEENYKEVNIEEEDLTCVMTVRTSELECDFSEYMRDGHSYFFAVRAVPRINEQAYVVPGDWVASKDKDYTSGMNLGITGGKWRNYLEGSKYEDADGNILSPGWHLIQGAWYYLNENGYRQSGWQNLDGNRYYLDESGRMTTGWFLIGENWYYANKEGAVMTGWIMTEPGVYYYLDENGVMLSNCEIEGYWLDEKGIRQDISKKPQETAAEAVSETGTSKVITVSSNSVK